MMAAALWRSGASRTLGRYIAWSCGRAPTRWMVTCFEGGLVLLFVCIFCFSPFGVLARRRGLELTELIGVTHVGVASGLCALALCFEISVLSRLIVILLLLCFGVQSVNVICRLMYLHMVVVYFG